MHECTERSSATGTTAREEPTDFGYQGRSRPSFVRGSAWLPMISSPRLVSAPLLSPHLSLLLGDAKPHAEPCTSDTLLFPFLVSGPSLSTLVSLNRPGDVKPHTELELLLGTRHYCAAGLLVLDTIVLQGFGP